MKSLLTQLANGKRDVVLIRCSYSINWTCTIEQRAAIDGDQTNIKISVEHEDADEAVRLAHAKFFKAVGIFPELQPAIEHRGQEASPSPEFYSHRLG